MIIVIEGPDLYHIHVSKSNLATVFLQLMKKQCASHQTKLNMP